MGQSKTLSGFISPGTPESPVTTIITDSNVTAFMDPIPEQLTVNGTATFGDGVTSGSVNTDDYVTATVIISSPLEMVIGETTFDGDWESTEIDQNDIHKLTDNIIQARVFTTIVNHLPLELEAEFYLSGDSATLYSNPAVTMGPVGISRGSLNPDGTVDTAVVSENIIELNSEQTRVLENEILWLGQRFTLAGTDGQTVRFTANDSLTVRGYIEVDFTVSEDLWED
jgi:hypothetical protein